MSESKIYSRRLFSWKKGKKFNTNIVSVIIVIIIAVVTFLNITKAINPMINDLCIDKAKNIATIISNEEATVIMDQYSYDDLITITRDKENNVKMLQTNTKNINKIISDIPVNIVNKFNEEQNSNISIYLGSITGLKIFSAVGPKINIRISHVGNVNTKLVSEFTAQGINQTLHRVYLNLDCEVTILTPYNTIKQKIENQVLIAESVIVGVVPDFYFAK